jgi:eukaryotic-like serine/threonine-protein kinase
VGREDLLPSASPPADGEIIADRYVLERSLGNGGMGEVWVATDRMLGRRVALKELSPALAEDEPARARFFREARALARISHPNVVGVFDVGEDDGRPFLVMELVEGTTLERELEKVGRLPFERAAEIGAGIAAGLAAAHENGVVHRDVKPSNIFLTSTGEPKVGDFGIARLERGEMTTTLTGTVFGSPAYVSPEQVTGGKIGPRADLYALGCVLYRMLAGRPPFEGDPMSLTYQQVHESPAELDAMGLGVPAELSALVSALLAKDPVARPRSADEVQHALAAFVAQLTRPLPAVAPTAELPVAAAATRGRWPWPIVAIGVAALLLIALMGWAFAHWGGDAPAARRQASPRASAPSPSLVTTTAPSPSPTQPSSAQGPVAALSALVAVMQASGTIDPHLADAIQHTIADVSGKMSNDPDKAREALDHLREEIQKSAGQGRISSAAANTLLRAIDAFGATIPSSEGGEGD